MKKTMFLLIIVSTIISCKIIKPSAGNNSIVLEGRIEKIGMSTFQYGTHLLKKEGKTYALKTTAVKLDDYVGKDVSIKGNKVEGYPVENGPELIDVKKITIK